MKTQNLKIVFLGAGAVGASSAAWVAQKHVQTTLLARGAAAEAVRAHGVTLYWGETPEKKETMPLHVITDLAQAADVDVVVLAVKLFQLEEAARQIRESLGDRLVVGMQNGLANQEILPRYFSRVVYCVVGYNCWVDEPGVVGYQKRGPLILGTPDNSLQAEMDMLAQVMNPALETVVTDRFQDAAHCKLVINLSNSVTTLVGLNRQPISATRAVPDDHCQYALRGLAGAARGWLPRGADGGNSILVHVLDGGAPAAVPLAWYVPPQYQEDGA